MPIPGTMLPPGLIGGGGRRLIPVGFGSWSGSVATTVRVPLLSPITITPGEKYIVVLSARHNTGSSIRTVVGSWLVGASISPSLTVLTQTGRLLNGAGVVAICGLDNSTAEAIGNVDIACSGTVGDAAVWIFGVDTSATVQTANNVGSNASGGSFTLTTPSGPAFAVYAACGASGMSSDDALGVTAKHADSHTHEAGYAAQVWTVPDTLRSLSATTVGLSSNPDGYACGAVISY